MTAGCDSTCSVAPSGCCRNTWYHQYVKDVEVISCLQGDGCGVLPRSPCSARRSDTFLDLGPWTRPDPRQLCKTPPWEESRARPGRSPSAATFVLLCRGEVVWCGRGPRSGQHFTLPHSTFPTRVPASHVPWLHPAGPRSTRSVAWLCSGGGTNRCNGNFSAHRWCEFEGKEMSFRSRVGGNKNCRKLTRPEAWICFLNKKRPRAGLTN